MFSALGLSKMLQERIAATVAIFFILKLSSGFGDNSGTKILIVSFAMSIFCLLFSNSKDKLQFNRTFVKNIALICLSIILTFVINIEPIKDAMIFVIYFCCSLILTKAISKEKFIEYLTDIIVIISLASLIVFFAGMFQPALLDRYGSPCQNSLGYAGRDYLLSVYVTHSYRNYGIFWEPGAFQIFLNYGIIYELFCDKRKGKTIRIIALLTALITTFSTTGYISLCLILMAFFIESKNNNRILPILCLIPVAFFIFSNSESYYWDNIWNKLGNRGNSGSSANIRLAAFYSPFIAMFDNIVFGVGYRGLKDFASESGFRLITCTPSNWFGIFGIIIGTVFNICYCTFWNIYTKNNIVKIILSVTMIVIICSEEVSYLPIILSMLMYQLMPTSNTETKKNGELYESSRTE